MLLFFKYDLHLLVPAALAQILILIAELVIPTGIATNEENVEIET